MQAVMIGCTRKLSSYPSLGSSRSAAASVALPVCQIACSEAYHLNCCTQEQAQALQQLLDNHAAPEDLGDARSAASAAEVVTSSHKLCYTTFAPPAYQAGVTVLHNFRPPMPQEWQLRASQLHIRESEPDAPTVISDPLVLLLAALIGDSAHSVWAARACLTGGSQAAEVMLTGLIGRTEKQKRPPLQSDHAAPNSSRHELGATHTHLPQAPQEKQAALPELPPMPTGLSCKMTLLLASLISSTSPWLEQVAPLCYPWTYPHPASPGLDVAQCHASSRSPCLKAVVCPLPLSLEAQHKSMPLITSLLCGGHLGDVWPICLMC